MTPIVSHACPLRTALLSHVTPNGLQNPGDSRNEEGVDAKKTVRHVSETALDRSFVYPPSDTLVSTTGIALLERETSSG